MRRFIYICFMLIQTCIELLTPNIQSFDFVETWGGVVQTVEKETTDGNVQRVPVSCSSNIANCNNGGAGAFQYLTPDSAKKSVVYCEVLQPFPFDTESDRRAVSVGRARLVYWLNKPRLGWTECNAAAKATRAFLSILKGDYINNLPDELTNARVEFRPVAEVLRDYRTIFGNYDYNSNKAYYITPYDFGALDFEVRLVFPYKCNYIPAINTPANYCP